MTPIQKEILIANYWEHYKFAKDLAMIYGIDNPKRKLIEKNVDELQKLIKVVT